MTASPHPVSYPRAFRYGFQFAESNSALEVIRHTCRDLAIDQSLTGIA